MDGFFWKIYQVSELNKKKKVGFWPNFDHFEDSA
jgi:hypothetical protein